MRNIDFEYPFKPKEIVNNFWTLILDHKIRAGVNWNNYEELNALVSLCHLSIFLSTNPIAAFNAFV